MAVDGNLDARLIPPASVQEAGRKQPPCELVEVSSHAGRLLTVRSRLIFLNLPATLTPPNFKQALTSPPSLGDTRITDLKLVPKRRFAFVGYATTEEADRARAWFDGSYAFGGVKVKVDVVGDQPLAPKSKKAKVDSQAPAVKPVKAAPRPPAGAADDDGTNVAGPSRLDEFMGIMKGVDPTSVVKEVDGAVPGEAGWKADGLSKGNSKKAAKERPSDVVENVDGGEDATPAADDDDDAAWLRRRQVAAEGGEGGAAIPLPAAVPVNPDERLILSTARLFVRNLPFIATLESLQMLFASHGSVDEVHMPQSASGEPMGTAFVRFRKPEDAVSAWRALDKTAFMGRLLHVLPGRGRPGEHVEVAEADKSKEGLTSGVLGKVKEGRGEVKKGVEERRKQESKSGVNWASLYMNADAVAASVADRMGISKSDLLSSDSGNAAVALALAETSVVADVKAFFASHGLVVDALQPRTPRSQTVILIKNIPYGTTERDLRDLFEPHGALKRLLVPPSGTLGVAEYEQPIDAGKAFRALAYRRLGNAVLYLEKGPVGMFDDSAKSAAAEPAPAPAASEALQLAEKASTIRLAAAADDEAGSTLFLKNLDWATTSDRLTSLFASLPGFSFARVQTRADPKRPGERLSMGYGFVGFKTRDDARRAHEVLAGYDVDGKAVEVKWAQRGAEDDGKEAKEAKEAKDGKKTKGTKVLVKNLPFEATKKDVRELFSAYGSLKSLRLPRKATLSSTGAQSTRGFAFLEFTTHAEAQRAMGALKHTHLLGRHLVMEWAKAGEGVDVDALREKVGRDVRAGESGRAKEGRKRKADLGREERDDEDGLEL